MIVPESGTTKRTHLAPLYHPDALVNPDTYIVTLEALALKLRYRFRQKKTFQLSSLKVHPEQVCNLTFVSFHIL